ncbi:hypothetical protein [Streptomyces sp. NPDC048473]|uniref:hypothetical protein n=1 Tax=unclassified Streptomyces TaxID=2593676 RepID=UPI0037120A40
MSQEYSASSGAPPSGTATVAAGPPRIRRAIAMPSADESLSGSSPAGVTRSAAFLTTASAGGESAGTVTVASTPVTGEGAQQSGPAESGRGRRGRTIFSLSGRRQHSPPSGSASADEAGLPGAAAVSGVQTVGAVQAPGRPGATATHAGRSGRPLLVAAAVAGAVLATVPFVNGHGGTTNYEGLGQAVPIASRSPDADGNSMPKPDGHSSMPLQDPVAGTQAPIVPQPQISPTFLPESPSALASGPLAGVLSGQNEAVLPPGKTGPLAGPGLYTDPQGHGPTVGPTPAIPGGKDGPRLVRGSGLVAGLALGDKPKDEKTDPKGSKPVETDNASHPEARQKPPTGDTPATSTRVSLLSTKSSDGGKAKPAVKAAGTAKSPTKAAARAATPVKAATPKWATRVVRATTVISPGESVASNRMRITMGTNGNLVISDENGVVRWSSHTEGSGYKAVFQDDGCLVVYAQDGRTAWSSGTAGNPGAQLVIQDDGNVTIQSASGAVLWSAGTQR